MDATVTRCPIQPAPGYAVVVRRKKPVGSYRAVVVVVWPEDRWTDASCKFHPAPGDEVLLAPMAASTTHYGWEVVPMDAIVAVVEKEDDA